MGQQNQSTSKNPVNSEFYVYVTFPPKLKAVKAFEELKVEWSHYQILTKRMLKESTSDGREMIPDEKGNEDNRKW